MSICYRHQTFSVVFLLICHICTVFVPWFCHAANSIKQGQFLKNGETLVSNGLRFEMGFFEGENSTLRYVGIWYKDIAPPTFIWVANRDVPLTDTASLVTIGSDGNLIILDGANRSVWSSHATSRRSSTNPAAVLQDTGNLILLDGDDTTNPYWQSFDHPGDTFLPSMKVSVNATMGENFCFNSWRSPTDPSPGNYVMGIDPRAAPQIVVWERSSRRWRSGYWDGRIFTGVANMTGNYLYGFKLSDDGDNRYLSYALLNQSDKLRFQITWDGYEKELRWNDTANRWEEFQLEPSADCDVYNKCGNFGICSDSGDSRCNCVKGFEPVYEDQWKQGNESGGCRRKTPLKSERNVSAANKEDVDDDGFLEVKNTKLPDFAQLVEVGQNDMVGCEAACLQNDSCTAFTVVNGIGCMVWHGDLYDIRVFDGSGNSLHVRLSASDLDTKRKISVVVIIIAVMAGLIFLGVSILLIWRFKFKLKVSTASCYDSEMQIFQVTKGRETSKEFSGSVDTTIEGDQEYGPELPLFNFNCVAIATDHFSEANKLGQGGFGPVYKGMLPGGQEIALKRLSRRSGQGSEEFKNEVILLAKLQHRNLVRLLGCCIQGEEKMLLYEYLPNKSLDYFIFDPAKHTSLDWKKRFNIIEGIARGLLYLHRDSRLRIIHRDLKASNILLDEEMNPKISDFGMARIFGGNQHEANTNRVVGTYGYMSPEYAMEGLFSVKSDVYSFGVLLLEIVSGRKNTSFRLSEYSTLVEYAWNLWSEGKAMELVDPLVSDSCCRSEVLRCIHVGMLCVQDSAIYRPTMATVVLMLESEATTLPLPRQPTFNSMRSSADRELFVVSQEAACSNDLTITMLTGR